MAKQLKLSAFVALVVVTGALWTIPAKASPSSPAPHLVGSVVGTAPFSFDGTCDFVHQHFIGSVTTRSGGDASIDVDVCVELGDPSFPAAGRYAITAGGKTVTGNASGSVDAFSSPAPFRFTLNADAGQRGGLASTRYFSGEWTSNNVDGGPFTGAIR